MKIHNFFVGLYRKVVSYVLLHSGLGSPTEIAVVREATGMRRLLVPCVNIRESTISGL